MIYTQVLTVAAAKWKDTTEKPKYNTSTLKDLIYRFVTECKLICNLHVDFVS